MIELLLSLASQPAVDYTPKIACESAYVLLLEPEEMVSECCGECDGGKIVHGDGHVTDCPCPETCVCKTDSKALVHEHVEIPLITKTESTCKNGKCTTILIR